MIAPKVLGVLVVVYRILSSNNGECYLMTITMVIMDILGAMMMMMIWWLRVVVMKGDVDGGGGEQ